MKVCGESRDDAVFHVHKPFTRAAVKIHNTLGKRDTSVESRDETGSLWKRKRKGKDCAV
jgi:hypothetical protein